jgi:2',3'-cyclic-nucleotide 2'-phosphodiesterase (5'-nucleotidase family)
LNYLKKKLTLHYKSIILLLSITSCNLATQSYVQPTSNINITNALTDDEAVSNMMSKAMNEVIGFCPAFLEKEKPSSILGSFMAEATLQAAASTGEKVDFCLLNYGGIRSTLDSGYITIGEVFEIMPFENEITILTLSKAQMDTLYTVIAKKGGEPFANRNWQEKTTNHKANSASFRLVTNDYMANGGDNYTILTHAKERIDTGIKIRDGLITYIKAHNPLPLIYTPSIN